MNRFVEISTTLSPRQKEAYDFIVKYMEDNGFCPTIMEIQAHMNYASPACVWTILRELEYKGKIELPIKGAPRAIRVIGMKFVKEDK